MHLCLYGKRSNISPHSCRTYMFLFARTGSGEEWNSWHLLCLLCAPLTLLTLLLLFTAMSISQRSGHRFEWGSSHSLIWTRFSRAKMVVNTMHRNEQCAFCSLWAWTPKMLQYAFPLVLLQGRTPGWSQFYSVSEPCNFRIHDVQGPLQPLWN